MIKIYNSGQAFLKENNNILEKYPLETVFFGLNAQYLAETNKNDFILRLDDDGRFLIAVHVDVYPMVLFGDNSLCDEFARFAVNVGLTFKKILGAQDTCETFLAEYGKLEKCTYKVNHAMDIMRCSKPNLCNFDGVENATNNDVDELAQLVYSFGIEAMGESDDIEDCKRKVDGNIRNFAVIRKDNKIVTFASKARETEHLTAINSVYTLPQYRGQGLSRKTVTYLTKSITDCGKLAYLFVDKTNPISNHLYTKIGYIYAVPQYEYILK